jgi:hypothetical protein
MCLFVNLGILHALRMRHIAIFGLPGSSIFLHIISQNHPLGTKFFHAIRQTDEEADMTKLIVYFCNLSNAP